MADTDNCVFVLENSLAAVSACDNGNGYAVTDGFESSIYMYSRSGVQTGTAAALRPYRRLRHDPVSNGYSAVSCCGGGRIYRLGSDFSETGFITLETARGQGEDEIADACITRSGSESYYTVAFPGSVYLFGSDGRRLAKLCETAGRITDLVAPTPEFRAAVEERGGSSLISVYNNGKTVYTAVPKRFTGCSEERIYTTSSKPFISAGALFCPPDRAANSLHSADGRGIIIPHRR